MILDYLFKLSGKELKSWLKALSAQEGLVKCWLHCWMTGMKPASFNVECLAVSPCGCFIHVGLGVSLESDSFISFLRFIIKAATFWEQMRKGTEDFAIQTGESSLNSSFHYGTHVLPQLCLLSSSLYSLSLSISKEKPSSLLLGFVTGRHLAIGNWGVDFEILIDFYIRLSRNSPAFSPHLNISPFLSR